MTAKGADISMTTKIKIVKLMGFFLMIIDMKAGLGGEKRKGKKIHIGNL